MPQGVLPAEQLAKVPSTRVPVGSALVRMQRVAARGTVDVHGRARGDAAVLARGQIASPAFRIAIELHHGDAVCRLHERDCLRMLVQPRLARIGLHASAAMAGPDEFARSRIHGSRRRGRARRDRLPAKNTPRHRRWFRTDVPARRPRRHPASASAARRRRVEIAGAGYETVTPARDDVVAIAVGDRECIVVLRRDAGERAGRQAPLARCVGIVRTSGKSHRRSGTGHDGAARQARRKDGIKGGSFHGSRMLT